MAPPLSSSSLAIVMPVLNEAAGIEAALRALAPLRARGARVVVADGGSADDTLARARRFDGVEVIQAPRGRAAQMNAGALAATGDGVPSVPARRHHVAAGRGSPHCTGAGRQSTGLGAGSTCASTAGRAGCPAWPR
jgi:hypothetical protein